MFGSNGSLYGVFSATSLKFIKALELQEPAISRTVPQVDQVNSDTMTALVDFHEGNYHFPDRFGTLTHHVVAADILGDDTFIEFVAEWLKIPCTHLHGSHSSQELRKIIRD